MGLLDAESVGKINSMLNPDSPDVDSMSTPSEPEVSSEEPTSDAPHDESVASSSATEDVTEDVEATSVDDGQPSADDGHSHHVPYNRFKQVLDARNTHKGEVAALKREMAQLRESMSSQAEESYGEDDDYLGGSDLDDLLGEYGTEEEPAATPDVGPQMQEIMSRIEHFEVYQAEQELTREVAAAKEQYPNVPDDVLYEAVVRDPSASVLSIAEHYSTFVGGIEEAAIAKYMSDHGMETPQVAAPPRPARSGAPPRRAIAPDQTPPKNLTEAKAALMQYLAKNNIFKR